MAEKRSKSGEFTVEAGRIYPIGSPETQGSLPVKTELTVMAADDVSARTIGWTVREYSGGAVARVDDNGEVTEPEVKGRDTLKEGDRILAMTLVGHVLAVVGHDDVGDLCWVSEGLVGDLEYDEERGYWITTLAINKKLLV